MSKYIPRNVLVSVVPICVVITLLSVYWFRKKKKFKFDSPSSDSIVLKSDLTAEVCSDSADTLSDASSLASPMSSEKSLRTKNLNDPQDCLDGSLHSDAQESPVSKTTSKAVFYSSVVSNPEDVMAATSIAKDIISQVVERAAEDVLESKSPFQPNQNNKNDYDNNFLVEVNGMPFQFDMEKLMKGVETNSNDSRSSVLDENSLSYVSDDSEGRQPSKNKDSLSSVLDENSLSYVSDDSEVMTELKARDSALSATESEQEHMNSESPNTEFDSVGTQNIESSTASNDSVVLETSQTEVDTSGVDNADSQQPEETHPIETTSTSPDVAEIQKEEVRLTNGPTSNDLDQANCTTPASPLPKENIPNGPTSDEKVLYNGHHPALTKGTFSDVLSNKKPTNDGPKPSLSSDFEVKLNISEPPQRQLSPKKELSYSQALKGSLPKHATCDNRSSPSSTVSAKSSSDESASSSSPPECSEKPSQEVDVSALELMQPQHGYDDVGWSDDHPNPHEVLDDLKDLKESGEYRYEFELPQELCGRLIGKQGKHVRSIKDRSNANVYIKRHPFDPQLKIVVVEGTSQHLVYCPCMLLLNFFLLYCPCMLLSKLFSLFRPCMLLSKLFAWYISCMLWVWMLLSELFSLYCPCILLSNLFSRFIRSTLWVWTLISKLLLVFGTICKVLKSFFLIDLVAGCGHVCLQRLKSLISAISSGMMVHFRKVLQVLISDLMLIGKILVLLLMRIIYGIVYVLVRIVLEVFVTVMTGFKVMIVVMCIKYQVLYLFYRFVIQPHPFLFLVFAITTVFKIIGGSILHLLYIIYRIFIHPIPDRIKAQFLTITHYLLFFICKPMDEIVMGWNSRVTNYSGTSGVFLDEF